MTPGDLLVEAVLVTIGKAVTVCCIVATVAIIGAAFWKGRTDTVWPERSDR